MSDRQIRNTAWRRMALSGGSCVSVMVFLFSIFAFLVLCEGTMYLVLRDNGYKEFYDIEAVFSSGGIMAFWVFKTLLEFAMLAPVLGLVRRLFIDLARGNSTQDTRQYIAAHAFRYYMKAMYSSLIHNAVKLFAAVPGILAAYGIYHFSYVLRVGELTSRGLFALTVCVSIVGAWVGLLAHYYISLALTPFIMALNPRTNVFDACDLSVKLMDGNHGRYLRFLFHFVRYLPLLLLVYPFFLIYPYFTVSYTLLIDEILGDYRQDKMPGMVRRWRKHQ
ncbi:MAG: hypothetical protein IJ806_01730 [Ruminococcus sp.]|nr:hypothetical protein [Ruminococcus sp.]